MRPQVVLLAFLLAPAAAAAQTDTSRALVSGVVIDPFRQPIEGAELRIVGSTASAMTSKEGTFRFFIPAHKEVLIRIRRPGYRSELIKVTGEWKGAVLLEPGTFELPEIRVTARYAKPARYAATHKYDDYFRRRRQGLGQFIDREEIERRQPMYAMDLFQGRTGIKVSWLPPGIGSTITFARCNERMPSDAPPPGKDTRGGSSQIQDPKINIYLDGRRLYKSYFDDHNGSILEQIPVGDIELVEIFRGPAELPPEFNDGNCAAIVFWTRQGGR